MTTHTSADCHSRRSRTCVLLGLIGVLLSMSGRYETRASDAGSFPGSSRVRMEAQLDDLAARIRDIREKLRAPEMSQMRAGGGFEGGTDVTMSFNQTRLELARLGLALATTTSGTAVEANAPAVALAQLDVKLASRNMHLAWAEMDLQRYLAMPEAAREERLQTARRILAEFRARETQLIEQRITAMESTIGDLHSLGIGVRPTSARPPRGDTIPDFPWPPPKVSGLQVIPEEFFAPPFEPNCLGDVEKRLRRALNRCEYSDLSYFAVPDGFAVVTRVEQINADGTPKGRNERFIDGPAPSSKGMSFTKYLKALFLARPGYYRIIVFVVTPRSFSQSSETISRDQADAWLSGGGNALPAHIAALKWTPACECTALIYEFEQPNPGVLTTPRVPGRHQGREHLVAGGLWQALEVQP